MTQAFSSAALIEAAQRETGLSEFDSDSFREGLDILTYDLNRSAHVSETGIGMLTEIYKGGLENRLRVTQYLREHPNVLDAPVTRPIFIGGMPRTGTTLVSYLLDQDPAARSLLKWEVPHSAPPAAPGKNRTDPRCMAQMAFEAKLLEADKGLALRHYEAVDGPTECTFLHAQDFKSCFLEALSPVPTYGDWLLICDTSSAYAYQKKVLQLLQATNPGRWALKMPSHALFVKGLFEVFPDAQIIWTHRDPYAAIGSVMSLMGFGQLAFNRAVDKAYMAEHYPRQMAAHLRHMLEMSHERPNQVHSVYYDDLVTDPMGAMRKLYAALGLDFTVLIEQRMSAWLAANPQGKFGTHQYTLSEWGLTVEGLRPYFAEYLRAHPVAAA